MNLWAVIPSGNRPEMLNNLVNQLSDDGVKIVVIDTGYDVSWEVQNPNAITIFAEIEPKNISRWWNLGLDYAKTVERDNEHVVAVLNDDIVIPKRFVQKLAEELMQTGAAAAYPDQHDVLADGRLGNRLIHEYAVPVDLRTRLCGYAFALRGSANLRADETLQWWYGDDDLDWRARQSGGSVMVRGLKVEHLSANSTTVGKLAEQAGRDRQTFIDKWRTAPW